MSVSSNEPEAPRTSETVDRDVQPEGDEGRRAAQAAPAISGDDVERGQTQAPAPAGDVGVPSDEELRRES